MKTLRMFEKFAPILVTLLIVDLVAGQYLSAQLISVIGPKDMAVFQAQYAYVALVQNLLGSVLKVGIAIWLAVQARKVDSSPFLWGLFGFFFGLTAAILFFAIQILDELRSRK